MIQINQCKMPVGHSQKELEDKVRKILKLKQHEQGTWYMEKQQSPFRGMVHRAGFIKLCTVAVVRYNCGIPSIVR